MKGRRNWNMQIVFQRIQKTLEKRHLMYCITEWPKKSYIVAWAKKAAWWISHLKITLQGRNLLRISSYTSIKQKKCLPAKVSNFGRGRIVASRECELLFYDIACRTDWNPTTAMQIGNHWDAEGRSEQHAGFQCPPMSNAKEVQIYCEVGFQKPYNHIKDH